MLTIPEWVVGSLIAIIIGQFIGLFFLMVIFIDRIMEKIQ